MHVKSVDQYEYPTERMMEKWNTPIYAFWKPIPSISYDNGRRYHQFHCFKKSCSKSVKHYLDTSDATSTGNLHRHTKACWGGEVLKLAMNAGNLDEARAVLSKSKDDSIAEAFQVKGKDKVTYSHRQHTKTETWYNFLLNISYTSHKLTTPLCSAEIVRWVTENARPYKIVTDRGFKNLMKTGRPEYYLPSPHTVSRDVRMVFACSRQRIAAILHVRSFYISAKHNIIMDLPETSRKTSLRN